MSMDWTGMITGAVSVYLFGVLGFTSQLRVSQPSADDLFHNSGESFRICHVSIVVSECLFVNVAKKMERFHANVGSMQAALQQTKSKQTAQKPRDSRAHHHPDGIFARQDQKKKAGHRDSDGQRARECISG